MTKRDLVKWLEAKKIKAVNTAEQDRQNLISAAKEVEYASTGLDSFLDTNLPLIEKFLEEYGKFVESVNSKEGISISRYHWQYGHRDMSSKYGDRSKFRKELTDMIGIDTERYKAVRNRANEMKRNVESTYDTVITTVKNLPTAKDGLEYLKKLVFDVSEIQPAEVKKQLPATISVNVDVKYLLLEEKKDEDKDSNNDNRD